MFEVDDNHYFSSLTDFILEVKNRERKPGRRKSSEDNSDSSWTGTKSLNEAWEMIEKGESGVVGDKILQNLEKLNLTNKRSTQFNDIVGFAANVPAYLMGVPKTMINREVKVYRDKILNILVSSEVNCGVSTETIIRISTEIMEVILKLEQSGFRVNLYKMLGSHLRYEDKHVLGFIKLKDDRERINLKKMMFPMIHPSMLRRIEFKYLESFGKDDMTHDGYGQAGNWKSEIIAKAFKRICAGEFLFACVAEYDENWYQKAGIHLELERDKKKEAQQ